jgi:hypothetical protein
MEAFPPVEGTPPAGAEANPWAAASVS